MANGKFFFVIIKEKRGKWILLRKWFKKNFFRHSDYGDGLWCLGSKGFVEKGDV